MLHLVEQASNYTGMLTFYNFSLDYVIWNLKDASKDFNMLSREADSNMKNWVAKARNLQEIYGLRNSGSKQIIKLKITEHFASKVL